jgi:two-component system LytT family sensor kinase
LENDQFTFSITNPYDPDAVNTKGTGFGLESVKRRLYLLFARNDLLTVFNGKKEGADGAASLFFEASIKIPVVPKEDK